VNARARVRAAALVWLWAAPLACVTTGADRATTSANESPNDDAPGFQVDSPGARALRAELLSALERRDAAAVWSLLGPGPRAQMGDSEARFARWCERYCAEWLIEAAATSATPIERVTWGDVVVHVDGEVARVAAGPGIAKVGSAEAVLARLCSTLRVLANDPLFDATRRGAWSRLEGALSRSTERPGPAAVTWTLRVDGGSAVFTRDGDRWSVVRFDTDPL
jgi:hypothetical protein